MAGGMTLKSFLQNAAAQTDAYATAYLETLTDIPVKLREAMAYSLLGPGKRIRPALNDEHGHAGGKDQAERRVAVRNPCQRRRPPA